MSGVAHLLDATVTSAIALKPSTVYVVQVENRAIRATWHLHKCFSEFAALREKVLALIKGTTTTTTTAAATSPFAPSTHNNNDNNYNFDTGGSSTSTSSSNSCDSIPSLPGCCCSSNDESVSIATRNSERFPTLYKQFPRRQLFRSRSKRVIEQRTFALNAFVHELLLFVRDVKQQHQIAVYFSLMSYVEAFFECAAHATNEATATCCTLSTFHLDSPATLARTQAAAAAAAQAAVGGGGGGHRRPAHEPFSFSYDENRSSDSSERDNARRERVAPAAKPVNVAQQFYLQEYSNQISTTSTSTAAVSKSYDRVDASAAECAARAASPTAAWAARIEIAGISSITTAATTARSALPTSSKQYPHHRNHSSNRMNALQWRSNEAQQQQQQLTRNKKPHSRALLQRVAARAERLEST